eukprot:scaffold1531_cov59-Phaeocystis_antarctica.AAC.1
MEGEVGATARAFHVTKQVLRFNILRVNELAFLHLTSVMTRQRSLGRRRDPSNPASAKLRHASPLQPVDTAACTAVHRSDPSARGDLRARPADDSAALGTLQHPRLPDVDDAWPEAWAS